MKRNKFGHIYYTLPGGGMNMGETSEHALVRELAEETGLQLGNAQLVFIENAGEPYGTQYIYLVDYAAGEPTLSPASNEASISAMGQNLYQPMWLSVAKLEDVPFISDKLRQAVLHALQTNFPAQPLTI